jgi:hypothetical protein
MTMEKRDSYLYATVPLLLFSFLLLFASIWNPAALYTAAIRLSLT